MYDLVGASFRSIYFSPFGEDTNFSGGGSSLMVVLDGAREYLMVWREMLEYVMLIDR